LAASLANGLVAYWKMDEGLTDPFSVTLEDSAGDNDAVLTLFDPTTAWLEGSDAKFGSALAMQGGNNYADVPSTPALDITNNQVSVSAWVKLDVLPSDQPESFAGIYDAVEDDYVLYVDKGNKELRFKVTDAGTQAARPGIPQARLQTGVWMNVVGVYDGQARPEAGEARIYLNGQLSDIHIGNDSTVGAGLTNIVRAGQFGAIGKNGTQFLGFLNGAVDDVAIWSRALSVDEVGYIASGHPALDENAGEIVTLGQLAIDSGVVHLSWSGAPGRTYQVQRRSSLSSGSWEDVGAPTTATESTDTISTGSMFYRVVAN
jgi:hypothetical protein